MASPARGGKLGLTTKSRDLGSKKACRKRWACGFNVRSFTGTEKSDFSDAALALLEEFERRRKQVKRPVIFIAHSLGGLIVQAFLLRCSESLLSSIHGVLFLATPHYGPHEQSWMGLFARLDQVSKGIITADPLARCVGEVNDEFLKFLKRQHEHAFARKIVCLYETLPAKPFDAIIVERRAAILDNCDSVAVRADHLGISKLSINSGVQYQSVLQILRSIYCLAENSLSVLLRHSMESFSHGRLRNLPSTPDGCEEFITSTKGTSEARTLGRNALILEDQGWYDDAEIKYRKAVDLFDALPGPGHGVTLFCWDKLASMLRNHCKYEEAQSRSTKTLQERIRSSGKGTLPTVLSAGNLALAMRYRGNHHDAYSLLQDALESVEVTTSSPSLVPHVHLISILAKVVMECKLYEVAESLFSDVVRMAIALYGDRHPYTLNRISDLAVITALKGHMPGAEAISRHALDGLEQALGTDHPHCLRTARRLADYIRSQGRLPEANIQLKRILNIQKVRPGPYHPDTLSTMSSLGAVYAQQGYLIDAEALLRQVLHDQERLLHEQLAGIRWTRRALEGLKALERNPMADGKAKIPPSLIFIEPKFDANPLRKIQRGLHTSSAFLDGIAEHVVEVAMKGNQTKMDELVRTTLGENPDSFDLNRALREAAANHHEGIVLSLLDAGVDVNCTGEFHGTALQAAASAGNLAIVQMLLARRADVNMQGGIFGNALKAAILGRHRKITHLLLGRHPKQEILDSSLIPAVMLRQQETISRLLEVGANVNAADSLFGSPLQQASFAGHHDTVSLLLDHGADVNVRPGLFGSPLEAAITTNQKSLTHQLLDVGARPPGSEAFDGYRLHYKAMLTEILFERLQTAMKPEPSSPTADSAVATEAVPAIATDSERLPASKTVYFDTSENTGANLTNVVYPPVRKRTKSGFTSSSQASVGSYRSFSRGLQNMAKRTKRKLSFNHRSSVSARSPNQRTAV